MMALLYDGGTSTSVSTYDKVYIYSTTSGTSSTSVISTACPTGTGFHLVPVDRYQAPPLQKELQKGQTVKLPDGSTLAIDFNGNYKIADDEAQVIYKACRIREFNRFVNASDLLENFIRDLGRAGLKQGEVLGVPVEMFINWLVYKAAEADGDPIPEGVPRLEDQRRSRQHPRCRQCGRYIKKKLVEAGVVFCSGAHLDRYRLRFDG
jgi:hypothetical protein